jgi:hypothetical protein
MIFLMARDLDSELVARSSARGSWPIRAHRLGEEPEDDFATTTTAAERLAMIWPLTVDAWTLAGRLIPDYPRSEAPVRVIRSGIRGTQEDEGEAR